MIPWFMFSIVFLCFFGGDAPSQVFSGNDIEVDLNGNVFVLDTGQSAVRHLTPELVLAAEVGGSGWGDNQFDHPRGMWARNGIDVFVADYGNHRIQRFDRSLHLVSSLYTRESDNPDKRFGYPTDVALSRFGDLYVCDGENSRILKVSGLSRVERHFGGLDAGDGRLHNPTRIEIGPRDFVYVLDGERIVEFDAFGNFMRLIAPGVFHGDILLFADLRGLVVMSSSLMYFFDDEDRLRFTVPIETLLKGTQPAVRSMSFMRNLLYLLTDEGVVAVPDPRDSHSSR